MTLLAAIGTTLSYLVWPFVALFRWILSALLVALAPLIHLAYFLGTAMLLPLRLIAKFETLYIYLGVAALIGLITGSILHLSSSILVSLFSLDSLPEEQGRSAKSVRAAQEQRKLEDAWRNSTLKGQPARWNGNASMEKKYAEWLKDAGKQREDYGLLGQTILEEDDSEDDF